MADPAREEAVILVVGAETIYKGLVAEALAKGRGASEVETTKGGVRLYRRQPSTEIVVIDTTPLVVDLMDTFNSGEVLLTAVTLPFDAYKRLAGKLKSSHNTPSVEKNALSALSLAEKWISLNALRRLYGKLVFVVCVVDGDALQQPGFGERWFHLLRFIFNKHHRNIGILVKVPGGNTDSEALWSSSDRDHVSRFLLERYAFSNVSFENMGRDDLIPTVRTILKRSVFDCKTSKGNVDTAMHFRLKEVTSKSKDSERYGPWGPEGVILLGKTGSGKSTLVQMLTKGKLDPSSSFCASSSIRGETKKVTGGEGRGWCVVDTPGFGELKDEMSTISQEEAERRVKKFVLFAQGTYSHYIYVVKMDRTDTLEKRIWEIFQALFRGCQSNFTVVVSNADEKWMEQNILSLREDFNGCDSFLCGKFPPTHRNKEMEAAYEVVRARSLKRLEDELASLQRHSQECSFGSLSRGSIQRHGNEMIEKTNMAVGTAGMNPMAKMMQLSTDVSKFYGMLLTMCTREGQKTVMFPN